MKCSKCKIEKPENDFYKNYRNCKKCHRAIVKSYQVNNKEKVSELQKRIDLNKRYGITKYDYDRMFEKQNGRCALCDSESIGRKGSFHFCVDHNHKTGDVRGLLCHNCNVILGKIKDSKDWLRKALKYI